MSPIAPARRAAYTALRLVHSSRDDLPTALARVRARLADERDRGLAAEIVLGALRWRNALDHVIETCSGRLAARLDPEVLDVLRVGAYQLLHLDRVPPAAIVSDAADLTREAGKRSAAGLVNAVLRRISDQRASPPLPGRPVIEAGDLADLDSPRASAALEYLSITLSHPRWLVRRWLERVGFERTAAWCRFDNEPAPITLRANRLRTTPDALAGELRAHGVVVEAGRFAPDALIVREGNPLATALAGTGLFFVQDEASQLVALMPQAAPGERVLDTCASPGGKTTAMAGAMAGRGVLVAADLRERRVALLGRTLATAGADWVHVVRADAGRPLPFGARFDVVLVDVPCSGLGTLRRDPDIRWRRTEAELPRFAARELRMLEHASTAVAPRGRLVYATCSSEPDENEDVVRAFLGDHREFQPVDPRTRPGGVPDGLAAVLDDLGRLQTQPDVHGLEHFFAAVLERRS